MSENNESWAIAEEWRSVPRYEGIYEVSNMGRIRRIGKAAKTGKGQGGGARIGRILQQQRGPDGYFRSQLWMNGKYKNFLVHRLVALAFLGPAPNGREVNHKSGDKSTSGSCRQGNPIFTEPSAQTFMEMTIQTIGKMRRSSKC